MADKTRGGRGVDDRDVVRKAGAGRRAGATEREAASTERIGREQQRRATAYGRAGAALLGGEVEPRVLSVRLFWDAGRDLGDAGRAEVRRRLRSWLLAPEGGELTVPGDPAVTYRDAVCTGCGGWSSLFEDGSCEVEFTCFDPIGYGRLVETGETPVGVGGTWRTWPEVRLVASAGGSVEVFDAEGGRSVRLERTFRMGDAVELDFLAETARVNGEDASADVTLASDFFAFEPGVRALHF